MDMPTLRKYLKDLDTAAREALAKKARCGVATIHRIANDEAYLPNMRTFIKLAAKCKQ